jgi:hypothetical protein
LASFAGTLDRVLEQGRLAERMLAEGPDALPKVKAALLAIPDSLRAETANPTTR